MRRFDVAGMKLRSLNGAVAGRLFGIGVVASFVASAWLMCLAAAWIVRNDVVTFRLRGVGLGLVSDVAETVFAAGPWVMTVFGVVLGAVAITGVEILRSCRR
jgi:hypothetical protein